MSNTATDNQLANNLAAVLRQIKVCAQKAGREKEEIRLIVVSKTRTLDEVKSVAALGQSSFGENTIQDAMTKIPYLTSCTAEWHFIGHLQSKKAGKLPGYFQWIHSVDSLKLARKLSGAMINKAKNSQLNCLIQVNVSGEQSKSGLMPADVETFLREVLEQPLPCLRWRGLMTIGVQGDEQQTRNAFKQLRELQESCKQAFGLDDFDQLSMGMSGDYCLAIEEGATMVRVGTSIFGPRQ
ncbi:MAG: YggS family pyridoxal phosphate-dependent enzyme [Gammaproteobacteria bacterium]|nr:YggS family pyridoxal phosphate-dependent enzyme [Gammaproteobacteria bacterium]MBT8133222.1 YggS family pyridoxal phosphate-dependent enzyme [Gammaproteobacteria bacterium]NNJ50519.1 YggS family pyridoxal phosphate-dependent enzyme [Gammaproteobacteria bacterium]